MLVIGGLPRSGTTLLRRLCGRHPEMLVTHELGNFLAIHQSYYRYCLTMLQRWHRVGHRSYHFSVAKKKNIRRRNLSFLLKFLWQLRSFPARKIEAPDIERALRLVLPNRTSIGDKYRGDVFGLDRLVGIPEIKPLIIYRDCRDVTNSTLAMTRSKWQHSKFIRIMNTPQKIARRWVAGIQKMQQHAGAIYALRYESLATNPKEELRLLGNWLGVAPERFRDHTIRASSVGKYKSGLTPEELESVMQIAGPTLANLGYE